MTNPVNPFESSQTHISGQLPFGREEVIREIFTCLNRSPIQGLESFSLVGPKYIGKTTVLLSLLEPTIQQQYLNNDNDIYLIYFDCLNLPSKRLEVFRLLGKKCIDIAESQWDIQFHNTIVSDNISSLTRSSEIVEIINAFEGILKILSEQYNRYIVFVFDNFEKLLSLLTETDIHFMRDMFTNTKHALVVSTLRPIREHSPKTFPSKFYEIFKKNHLQTFSIDQAYQYLSEKSQYSKRIFSHSEKEIILEKVGNHPHFLNIYAAEAWQRKFQIPAKQSLENFSRIDRKVRKNLGDAFLSLWSNLDKEFQTILYEFASEQIPAGKVIKTLQRLEGEHGVVYRNPTGNFKVMGELFKDFVISQTEVIDLLIKTDFYRAGLKALEQIKEDQYFDTDPEYYYQKAFQQFSSSTPDYDSTNAMIRNAFERLLDVMVKRAESSLERTFTGAGYKERMSFIEEAFDIEGRISKLFSEFWNVSNEDGSHPGKQANMYNTQLRFYMLSGITQYLINAKPK